MSTREPLWYCHECHAEMRPLMVPDPVCASCHGSFVEKLENAADDPRQFAAAEPGLFDGPAGGMGDVALGPAALLLSLQSLMDRGMRDRPANAAPGPSITFEVRGPTGSRTMHFGRGANTTGNGGSPRGNNDVPNMSTFLGANPFGIPIPLPTPGGDRPNISGPLMANYLMALLGHNEPGVFGMPENGRMGDYVFNQEALDQIISQIMENSNAHRPVPAPEDVIAKLPREVLVEGSATLERDCAVCKEQFKVETEDPDEQIVVTLPCKHPFHQPCIIPWLTSSGTCPVCRFALVPQPDHHPPTSPSQATGATNATRSNPTSPGQSSSNADNNNASRSDNGNRSGTGQSGPGFIQSIFSNLMGLAHPHSHENNDGGNNRSDSTSNNRDNPTGESRGQQSSAAGPLSPSSDRPRSPPPQQGSNSSPWGSNYDYQVYRRSPLHSPPLGARPAPSSPSYGSRYRPGSPPARNSPPSRRDSDNASGRGSSAPPGSPGSAAQRRRDEQQGGGHTSLPGSWSDELD